MLVLKRNQIIITALIIMIAVAGYLNYQDSKSSKQSGIALTESGEVAALAPSSVKNNDGSDIGVAITYNSEDDNPAIATNAPDAAAVSGNKTAAGSKTSNSAQTANKSANSSTGNTAGGAANSGTANSAAGSQAKDPSSQEDPGASVFVNSQTTDSSADSSYFITAKFDREQARSKEKGLLMDMINNTNLGQDKKAEAADSLMQIQKRIEKESAAEAMIEAKGFGQSYVRIDDDSVDVLVSKSALTDAEIAQIEDIVKRKTGMTVDQIHISPLRK